MRVSTALGIGLSTLVLFAGCKLNTDYFSDYRGKNLLSNTGFSSGKWALVSDSTSSDAGYNPTPSNFMNWVAASSDTNLTSAYRSDSNGGSAYRLEILNLIPDGDFETETSSATSFTTPASTFWATHMSSSNTLVFSSSGTDSNGVPLSINHNTMNFGSAGTNDYVTLDVGSAVGAATWVSPNPWTYTAAQYQFHMDFYNASEAETTLTMALTQGSSTTSWDQSNLTQHGTTLYSVSEFIPIGNTTTSIAIGSTSFQDTAYIDNVRLVNASIDPSVKLSYSSLSSGTLQLLPGTKSGAYVFSLYVRDDPTADQTSTAATHASNRFYASGLTVTVTAAVKSGSGTYTAFVARPSGGWTSWTKLSFNMGFDFVDNDSQLNGSPALTIRLSPTDTTTASRDAGSLLIAEPSLTYNP
jgi:hypothetical protein